MENRRLIFIYNANSDFLSGVKDSATKMVTGKSQCSLCTATWNSFSKKRSWAEKERRLKLPYAYYHRDDMPDHIKKFIDSKKINLPTVLIEDLGNLEQIITKRRLDKCNGDDECIWTLLKSWGAA